MEISYGLGVSGSGLRLGLGDAAAASVNAVAFRRAGLGL